MTFTEFFSLEHLLTTEGLVLFLSPIALMLICDIFMLPWERLFARNPKSLRFMRNFRVNLTVFLHVVKFAMVMTISRYLLMRVCMLSDEASFFSSLAIAFVYYLCEMDVYSRITCKESIWKALSEAF